MALLIKNPILATVISSPTVLPRFVVRIMPIYATNLRGIVYKCQHIVTVKVECV
jgi:hypothetical protein